MLILAHRGASADAPENTLLAFEKAMAMQVDGIEIDVHAVADEILVIHDRWLKRTTKTHGQLSDYTLEQLRELDAGMGQKIPTLWETMQCINGQCLLNIELKGISDLLPVVKLIDRAVDELNFELHQFLISSFNHHLLFEVKQLRADIQIGALTSSCPLDYAAFAQHLNAYSINIDMDCLTPRFVQDAKQRGLQVYVFTVDEIADLDVLAKMGVDGVFTNTPDKAMVRRAHKFEGEFNWHPEGLSGVVKI